MISQLFSESMKRERVSSLIDLLLFFVLTVNLAFGHTWHHFGKLMRLMLTVYEHMNNEHWLLVTCLQGVWFKRGVHRQEVSSSPHVVFVSVLGFLDDELSVEQDEATHDDQPQVHVSLSETHIKPLLRWTTRNMTTHSWAKVLYLKQHHRSNEHVDQRHEDQEREAGHQSAWGEATLSFILHSSQ